MTTSNNLEDLPWLAEAPDGFGGLCKTFAGVAGDGSAELQRLASFALDSLQSATLARAIGKRVAGGDPLAAFTRVKVALLAAWTTDYIADCLPAGLVRHGIVGHLIPADYDQILQEALDPGSRIYAEGADIALIAVDHRWLQLDHSGIEGPDEASRRVAGAIGKLRTVLSALGARRIPAILQTLPVPFAPTFGSFDCLQAGTLRHLVQQTNLEIITLARENGGYVLDVAALAEAVGTTRWFDAGQWNGYKLPFAAEFTPLYADAVGRLLGAIYGRSRKCLVLDLDNTLWGGAIGDDGVAGIKLGQGSALGEAFLDVQRAAARFKSRGIMLAVCSKNEDATARLPFREHPDMLLKEGDISVFRANWDGKASNIQAIAKNLNIGLDSLVFLDDNPAERAQVRAALPMVAVPEVGNDPSRYAETLLAAGYFEAVSFSSDDRLRTASYAMDRDRAELKEALGVGDYLASLEMLLVMAPIDAASRQRVTQLINKTNQFNLTTRRYTEAEVEATEHRAGSVTIQARLRDKFGDLGLIAVIIAQEEPGDDGAELVIETWLMSCRVLGRRVEEAMLDHLVAQARQAGITSIRGCYIPTPKNAMVAEMYPVLGFQAFAPADAKAARLYRLDLDRYEPPADLPFKEAVLA